MIQIIILPQAEEEMMKSAQYYNQRVSNLGFDFLNEVENAVKEIRNSPTRWSFVDKSIQKYILKRFPFTLFYEFISEEKKIIIISIAHQKRKPFYWKYRN